MGRRTLSTGRVDPLVGYRYKVKLGNVIAGFSNVSGLKEDSETIEYREGNELTTMHKIPGLASFDDVTFERGLCAAGADELLSWRRAVTTLQGRRLSDNGEGAEASEVYRDVIIEVLNRDGKTARTFTLRNAFPKSLEYSDLSADSSDVLIQSMVISHESLELSTPTDPRAED